MSDTQSQENVIDSPSTSASPGELLARQREQLGIPLADAARALNLRPAVVGGLEQDDYQEIPVAAYRRGYLRSYAKYLGMDDRLVLEAYQARSGGTDTERKVTPVSTARPPSRVGAWLFKLVTLLVIVGLIAVTVMWWQSRGGNEPPGFGSTSTEETATAPAEPTSEPDDTAASTDSSFTSGDESATLPSNGTNVAPSPTAAQEQVPSVQDNVDAITGLDESALDSTTDTASTAEDSDEPSEPEPSSVEENDTDSEQTAAAEQTANANVLELTFNEQSWTEIFDATNQRVFVGLQTPGTSTTVEGEPPFRLTVGNATGVELRYQGEEVDLPARAGANNVARFTLGE
ncbi:helix-turn-helix domain-containing protein [Halomonas sp. FeN2]|uniref:RodZ domain-containing protein n=1 Tax=Halomonadaceae TaxID=28256 RepID=UPI000C5AE350|nr:MULTISPECIES: RodZ domain-containing protein [unclassified Halomonas]MBF59083.1 helix-turn-helix domain-containing protein [Halomonas sp.]UBR48633.1 helix-turn-helix domain-containing protein [Halomonas sp. FeN2]